MSLRSRLALLFGMVALVASALIGAFSYRTTTTELTDSIDRFLVERVDETAQALRSQRDSGGRLGNGADGRNGPPGRIADGRPVADDDAIIQIRGPLGAVVSSGAALPAADEIVEVRTGAGGLGATTFDDITLDGESYRMASRAVSGGAVIQVARSTAEVDAIRTALVGRFALIASFVALLAAGLGWLIATRTTSPLRRLTTVASGVATSLGPWV